MEALAKGYEGKVTFYFVYRALIHPGYRGYVAPENLEERLQHVAEAKATLGDGISWLIDPMENPLYQALSPDWPNSQWLIGPSGEILNKWAWSRPDILAETLEGLFGPPITRFVKKPKPDMPLRPWPRAKKGPKGKHPLKVMVLDDSPHFVKLRAESSQSLLETGRGDLLLMFRPDPIHKVHWNNLAGPVRISFAGQSFETKQPIEEMDLKPREFLFQEFKWGEEPLSVTLTGWLCDDAGTWCRPVTYRFQVERKQDPFGGWRTGRFLSWLLRKGDHRNRN